MMKHSIEGDDWKPTTKGQITTNYNNRDIGNWQQRKLNAVCVGSFLGENQTR